MRILAAKRVYYAISEPNHNIEPHRTAKLLSDFYE